MGFVSDGELVLVMGSPEGGGWVFEEPLTVLVFFSLGGARGLEESGVGYQDDPRAAVFWEPGKWWIEEPHSVGFVDHDYMESDEALLSQASAQGVEGVVGGDVARLYADGFSVEPMFLKRQGQFAVRGDFFLDLENACKQSGRAVTFWSDVMKSVQEALDLLDGHELEIIEKVLFRLGFGGEQIAGIRHFGSFLPRGVQ